MKLVASFLECSSYLHYLCLSAVCTRIALPFDDWGEGDDWSFVGRVASLFLELVVSSRRWSRPWFQAPRLSPAIVSQTQSRLYLA